MLPAFNANAASIVDEPASVMPDNESPYQCYQRGMEYYNARKYQDAIYWLKKATNAKYAYAYFPLAMSYFALPGDDNKKNAYRSFAHAIVYPAETGDENLRLCYWWLAHMKSRGTGTDIDYDGAIHFFKKAREYDVKLGYSTKGSDDNIASCREKLEKEQEEDRYIANATPQKSFTLYFNSYTDYNFTKNTKKGTVKLTINFYNRGCAAVVSYNGNKYTTGLYEKVYTNPFADTFIFIKEPEEKKDDKLFLFCYEEVLFCSISDSSKSINLQLHEPKDRNLFIETEKAIRKLFSK